MYILLLIFVPIVAVFISLLIKKQQSLILEILLVLSTALQLFISCLIVSEVAQFSVYESSRFFKVDSLGGLLLLITSLIGFISACYSAPYFRRQVAENIIGLSRVKQVFILINLFLLAMYLAIMSASPIMMWIAIEATTLTTAFLVSFYSQSADIEAAWKYLIINSVGLLLAFLGTILFMAGSARFLGHDFITWQSLGTVAALLDPDLVKMAFIFILIGYGTKMGIAPMHTWRPDAYSRAPVPIVALLSGGLLNVAFMAILRFKLVTDQLISPIFSQTLFILFGILSILVAALAMFRQRDFRRLLAYSSIEHAGIMLLGFGFGGLGIFASILHMIYHSLTKSAMFLLAGNILLKYGSTDSKVVRGVFSVLPVTGSLSLIGFLAITGIPPFGLFISEFYMILAGFYIHPLIVMLILTCLGIIFFGFLKFTSKIMFGGSTELRRGEADVVSWIAPLVLVGFLILLSINIPNILRVLINNISITFKPYV